MTTRALLSGLALIAALALAGCNPFGQGPEFSIVSGSENTVLQPIVEEFCKQKNATCTFKYEGTLDIGLALQSDPGVIQDAVWPASSVWVDMFDTRRRVKSLTSVAQTPVVLGVRKSKAEQLGWIGKDVFMKDILAAVQNGSLKFLMTSATQSNSGASAYLAMLSSALGNKPVIEPGDLDNKNVQESVRALLSGVVRSSGSSGWLADLYVDSAGKGTLYDAMWNYEAVLKETNDKLATLSQEPLYAIYPADGVAMADSPIGFVDHGRGPEIQTFFNDLLAYLRSAPVQQRIADTGRRIPLTGVAAKPEPGWNFDPTRLVTAIRMPESGVIRQALTLYQAALRKPSLTALCLDFSGSMQGEGEDQLQKAMRFLLTPDEASKVLVQWSPVDQIIVIPFDGSVRKMFMASGNPLEQEGLLNEISRQKASGGTNMYACAERALQQIAGTDRLSAYLPAVVIMTDGKSDDQSRAFMRAWNAIEPRVPIFGITFGDADKTQLDTLAKQTSARVFDGGSDLATAFRTARGYN
ncbi:Ca-activated chloride channel family protein [Rhizobium aethiopicum]|uniref:Ca-activated chloride channel family protein n=1 Tax=Rhizobium aethiopicum TaxID=1138170 RepID=A0A1C3XX57_9HYPH|nr:substrate-binding domain-containing protein [Rhizobium aethiopicum]SCB56829.1 Ca-activated chloride channel family protein [Rhizobium aethiopicum]